MAITTYHSWEQPDDMQSLLKYWKQKNIRFREMNNVIIAAHTSYIDNILDQLMEFTESLSASQRENSLSLEGYTEINFKKEPQHPSYWAQQLQYSYVSRCNTNVSQSCELSTHTMGIRTNFCIKVILVNVKALLKISWIPIRQNGSWWNSDEQTGCNNLFLLQAMIPPWQSLFKNSRKLYTITSIPLKNNIIGMKKG